MVISIRPAEPASVTQVADLARATYGAAFGLSFADPDDLIAHLDEHLSQEAIALMIGKDDFLLAYRQDPDNSKERLVGFLQFGTSPDPDLADLQLRRLYVDTSQQRQGIGSSLMEAFLSHPQTISVRRVTLDVWEHNDGAQRFYARFGFKVVGTKRFAVASGAETTDDLIMLRDSAAKPVLKAAGAAGA